MKEQLSTHPIGNLFFAARQAVDRGVAAWHRFWFEPLDPLMLGAMRLLTGWMLLYNLLTWSLRLEMFFGRNGVQPLEAVKRIYESRFVFSFWLWIDDAWLWPVHFACIMIAAMFCLGAASRVTSILAFLITISYSQRVPVANFGFDQILGMMCLYLALAPSGAAISLDSLIRKWWRRRSGMVPEAAPRRFASARMASRLIQLHLCAIYFWAGFAKLKGPTWWTGEAMWNVLANQEYQTFDLTWMAWVPWLPYLIAHITILWETSFIVLVWNRRLRPLVLAMGTAMHVGIGAFLGMWTFGLIMTFAYLSFVDPETWRSRFEKLQHRRWRKAALPYADGDARPNTFPGSQSVTASKVTDTADTSVPPSAVTALTFEQPMVPQRVASVVLPSAAWRVLVIAIDGHHRGALRDHFRSHGFDCQAVDSLNRAMDLLQRQKYSAVVLEGGDYGTDLPTIVADVIDYADVPILMLLTASQNSMISHFATMPDVDCCTFPASLREIRGHVEAIVTRS